MWVSRSFRSNQMSDVSELFISLTKHERPWAIRSGHSEEKSDVSKLLISLIKNERMSESLIFLSESLIHSFFDKKWAIRSEIKWANSQPWQKGIVPSPLETKRHCATSTWNVKGLCHLHLKCKGTVPSPLETKRDYDISTWNVKGLCHLHLKCKGTMTPPLEM